MIHVEVKSRLHIVLHDLRTTRKMSFDVSFLFIAEQEGQRLDLYHTN